MDQFPTGGSAGAAGGRGLRECQRDSATFAHRVRSALFSNAAVIRHPQAYRDGLSIAAPKTSVGPTPAESAGAIEINVHTLRNWEQGRRKPEGPAIALLRIAARHPKIIRENLESAA